MQPYEAITLSRSTQRLVLTGTIFRALFKFSYSRPHTDLDRSLAHFSPAFLEAGAHDLTSCVENTCNLAPTVPRLPTATEAEMGPRLPPYMYQSNKATVCIGLGQWADPSMQPRSRLAWGVRLACLDEPKYSPRSSARYTIPKGIKSLMARNNMQVLVGDYPLRMVADRHVVFLEMSVRLAVYGLLSLNATCARSNETPEDAAVSTEEDVISLAYSQPSLTVRTV